MIQVERLARLETLLWAHAALPEGPEFDLRHWSTSKPEVLEKRVAFIFKRPAEPECHYAACAVGLACVTKAFADEGLGYEFSPSRKGIVPTFQEFRDYEAVEQFFGLSNHMAVHLFDPSNYLIKQGPIVATVVANRIRALINRAEEARAKRRLRKRLKKQAKQLAADAIKCAQLSIQYGTGQKV